MPVASPALSKYCETFSKKLDSGNYCWVAVELKNLTLVEIPLQIFEIIARFVINIVCFIIFLAIILKQKKMQYFYPWHSAKPHIKVKACPEVWKKETP